MGGGNHYACICLEVLDEICKARSRDGACKHYVYPVRTDIVAQDFFDVIAGHTRIFADNNALFGPMGAR